jgi:5-methylcytosine-specific restriction endonuclease McrA
MEELLKSKGKKPRTGKVIKCICGKLFYIKPSVVSQKNYCSKECMRLVPSTKITLVCKTCNKEYKTYRSHIKHRGSSYCSLRCNGAHKSILQLGENNPSWKNGISPENHRIRQSKQFSDWRKAVFERDNYTCVSCGKHGGYLEPDHIKPFAYFPELRFELSNGRTMCKPCHMLTDTYGVKAKRLYENKH